MDYNWVMEYPMYQIINNTGYHSSIGMLECIKKIKLYTLNYVVCICL